MNQVVPQESDRPRVQKQTYLRERLGFRVAAEIDWSDLESHEDFLPERSECEHEIGDRRD